MEIVFTLLLIITLATAAFFTFKADAAQRSTAALAQQFAAAQAYAQSLRRYEAIADAEAAAAQRRTRAEVTAAKVVADVHTAQTEAHTAAQAKLAQAEAAATRIIAEANHQAVQTAPPTKNILEGYADRHVLPTPALHDDLAEQLAFAEAGQKLCPSRTRTRSRISDGAEQSRKLETALEPDPYAVETVA